jgi:hypothetical protein
VIIVSGICYHKDFVDLLYEIFPLSWFLGKPYFDWYIPSALLLYLIFGIDCYIIKDNENKHKSLIYHVCCLILVGILLVSVLTLIGKGTVMLFFARIPVFGIGILVALFYKHNVIINPYFIYLCDAILIISIIVVYYLFNSYTSLYLFRNGLKFLPFAIIVPYFSFFYCRTVALINSLCPIIPQIIGYIGKATLYIYLVHMALPKEPIFIFPTLIFALLMFLLFKKISFLN